MFVVWSSQPTPRYEVIHETGDEMCTVVMYVNGRSVMTTDGDTAYRTEALSLSVAYKSDILQDIRDNYREWLAMAYEGEVTSLGC